MLWHFEGGTLPHARERILPNGKMQILVNLHEDAMRSYVGDGHAEVHRTGGTALCGAHARHFAIDTAAQRKIVGVTFAPGGAYPFFAPPSDVTCETHVDLDLLWGSEGASLRARLLDAPDADARLATLESILVKRALRPLERDPAVDFALRALDRNVPVADVVARIGTSPKRFVRRFAEAVGLTPKRFACVRRFQRVLDALEGGARVPWARVAVDCGYSDQPHLIHDFRAFSGIHPTAYRPTPNAGRNHVPLELEDDRKRH